ncbi:sugar (pentulose or hexulose) kinase [Mucilaginibacter frigoritolerans]|uniref:Sugar (Pentulose or hexulose) kinase n=1 Tax=Mucilaginibacter frigoritolerans TaxID=652788 RepID=A0A562TR91_9SPHI|nr:FGGY family carbohydrate kinase [Mucilaginibacter frigoritolerans]TWI95310.1 sugar (pentulose or hexulose) kinase [Mucilaginibacter frigoritolerans]
MSAIPVIAIFDVGKTNKKLFLFDEHYHIVYEKSARFVEIVDDEGYPCENIDSLTRFVFDSLIEVNKMNEFTLVAVNFSTYGASLVHIDENGKVIAPLYNYLQKYPESIKNQFYEAYGGEEKMAKETSSPVLGNLNSGMQLYQIKYRKPYLFNKIKYSLHLPQYLSYLLTKQPVTDITSIGCHTGLWDFERNDYHEWVYREHIFEKFAPLTPSDTVLQNAEGPSSFLVGTGLHDSSAALIPYLVNFTEPFVLISTGTWCISLNPFNNTPLTAIELKNDCLCYIQYKGAPVKASRLFAGNEHEFQMKRIATHFNVDTFIFEDIAYDADIIKRLKSDIDIQSQPVSGQQPRFTGRDLFTFMNYTEAYHQLMLDIVEQQHHSTALVLNGLKIRKLFVDGGFSKNPIFMNLLAKAFPDMEVFAASMAQATALGTAIAIHDSWNKKLLPADIVKLKYYSAPHSIPL